MNIAIKLCGITDERAVAAVAKAKADYAGFVHFPKSPRHLTLERTAELIKSLPPRLPSVLVAVDPDDELLGNIEKMVNPDYVQLHGKETPDRLRDIKRHFPAFKIIKAIQVKSGDDIAQGLRYEGLADILMFDAKPPELPDALPGGNGLSFNWALLKNRDFPLPWFLSGGLDADNVGEAIRQSGAHMVDVSSGIESAPGVKDPALIEQFVKAARA